MKILVIEDQPLELKLACHVLKEAGYSVTSVEAAEHAIASIRKDRPQIILIDMVLPGMDGLTLVRELKADPETSGIPIVAVTGYPERFSRMDVIAAGCDAFLLKPLSTRTLPQELRDAVARGESAS